MDIRRFVSARAHRFFQVGATYTPPDKGADPIQVRVVMSVGIQRIDEYGRLIAGDDFADFVLDDVVPERGGILSDIEGHSGVWTLRNRVADDGVTVTYHLEKK